jgi:hypothetical protein
VAAATGRAYDDLVRVVAPLIGFVGVESLTARALHLARRSYPWLPVTLSGPDEAGRPFTQVTACLVKQDPATATDAAGEIFATFTGLLGAFIGEPLAARLLRKAWPDAASDGSTQEKEA